MTGKKSILQWMLGHKPLSINGISALQGIKYQSTGVIDLQTMVKAIISLHVYGPFGSNLKICSKFLRNIRLNLSLSTTPITFTNLIYFLNLYFQKNY